MNNVISVIIPVYKVEKTICKCIDSVLSQSYKNFEIILVDDCSPDNSGIICDEYLKTHHNITVIHKEKNEGLGFARNSGLEVATGDFVFFLDSDDEIKCETFKELINNITENNSDVCLGGYLRVKKNNIISCLPKVKSKIYLENQINELAVKMLGANSQGEDNLEHMVAKNLYSLKLIKEAGIKFFSEREILAEDFVFSLDILKYAKKISICNYDGYIYYDNENTLTTSYRHNRFKLLLKLDETIKKRMNSLNISLNEQFRFQRTFLVIVQRCMSQEVRFNKFVKANKSIKEYCINNTVNEYICNLLTDEKNKRNRLMYSLIKYRSSILIYFIFYIYNIKKRGNINE